MAESKGPTATATSSKLAMSRALGAAFLNHQVEQLEKSVTNGPSSGNWRDRRQAQTGRSHSNGRGTAYGSKRPSQAPGPKVIAKKSGADSAAEREAGDKSKPRFRDESTKHDKDADVIVVDASVLVHALYQVKKWCKESREEIVIVPLEALNTLDLLKKGTSSLAQKARAASRILEAQVGTNPRIRVQRDDAFVPWDSIAFKDLPDTGTTAPPQHHAGSSPEWVRRTICCARWESDNAAPDAQPEAKPKVQLAVLAPVPDATPQEVLHADLPADTSSTISPVPLPAPHLHPNKFEPRSSGALVGHWAARAGIDMLEVTPAPAIQVSSDEERPPPKKSHGRGGRSSQPGVPPTSIGHGPPRSGLVERPPAVMAMMEMVAQPSKVVRVLARGEKLDPDP